MGCRQRDPATASLLKANQTGGPGLGIFQLKCTTTIWQQQLIPRKIAPGDLLHWHMAEGHKMRFCVVGSSTSGERFDNRAISDNSIYIHRFGLPELVEWVDAAGHGVSGKIKVSLPKMETPQDRQHYEEALATPQLIMIEGRSTKPKELDVFVGQPVYFVVRESPGISIVDEAILEMTDRATRRKDSN
jgi:hypothetical protein